MMRPSLVAVLALAGVLEASLPRTPSIIPRTPLPSYKEASLFEQSQLLVGKPERLTLTGYNLDSKQWLVSSTNTLFDSHTLFFVHIPRDRYRDFENLWFMISVGTTALYTRPVDVDDVPATYSTIPVGPFTMVALHATSSPSLRDVPAPLPDLRGIKQYHALLWLRENETNYLCIANTSFQIRYPNPRSE